MHFQVKNKYFFIIIISTIIKVASAGLLFAKAPLINSIDSTSGYNSTLTQITIKGKNFDTTCKAYISPGGYYMANIINTNSLISDIFISGNYAYIAATHTLPNEKGGFQIIDISNPLKPVITAVITGSIGNRGLAHSVFVSGNYAYIAYSDTDIDTGGLQIIDISNPAKPAIISSLDTVEYDQQDSVAYKIYVSGNNAYLFYLYSPGPKMNSKTGLQIIDISNPANPILVSNLDNIDNVFVSGNYAYATNEEAELYIIDVSNPANPILVSNMNNIYSIFVSGNYAFATNGESELYVIDVSNPANPGIVNSINISQVRGIMPISEKYAYVESEESGLYIIDISNPVNPDIVNNIEDVSLGFGKVSITENYIYLSNYNVGEQVQVIDISNPVNPVIINMDVPGFPNDFAISGNYLYTDYDLSELLIIDISNLIKPNILSSMDKFDRAILSFFVSHNYIYILNGKPGKSGFQIIDASNPAKPYIVSDLNLSDQSNDIYISDKYAYIAKHGGLKIIDISNPNSPYIIDNNININTSIWGGESIYVSGNYAYITDRWNGLSIIDISNPLNSKLISITKTLSIANNVSISGNYAYVADCDGLLILDISNPYNPFRVGSIKTPDFAKSVFISGNYAYIAAESSGLVIIDISNPANPKIIGNIDTYGGAEDVSVSGKYAYIADFFYGLFVIDISNPYNPQIIERDNIFTKTDKICVSENFIYVAQNDISLTKGKLQILHKPSTGLVCESLKLIDDSTLQAIVPKGLMSGKYNIKVINSNGEQSIIHNYFTVNGSMPNLSPGVSLKANSNFGYAPLSVNFTADAYDNNGNIVKYEWDFNGDGAYDSSTLTSTSTFIYTTEGTYNAEVKVTDNNGASAKNSVSIKVNKKPEEKKKKSFCLISIVQNSLQKVIPNEINFFTQFRDTKFMFNIFGAKLVEFYYKISPKIVDYIFNNTWMSFMF